MVIRANTALIGRSFFTKVIIKIQLLFQNLMFKNTIIVPRKLVPEIVGYVMINSILFLTASAVALQ